MFFESACYILAQRAPGNQRSAHLDSILRNQLGQAANDFINLYKNKYGKTFNLVPEHNHELTSVFDEMKDLLFENFKEYKIISSLAHSLSQNVKTTLKQLANYFIADLKRVFNDNMMYRSAVEEGVILNTTILYQLKDEFMQHVTIQLSKFKLIKEIILSGGREDELIGVMERTMSDNA